MEPEEPPKVAQFIVETARGLGNAMCRAKCLNGTSISCVKTKRPGRDRDALLVEALLAVGNPPFQAV
jgi:hypothetical protein